MSMWIIVIFIFSLKEVHSDINVALDRTIKYCNYMQLSKLMVDGDRDVNRAERINDPCDARDTTLTINLDAEYYIHYVVIYEGMTDSTFIPLGDILVDLIPRSGFISTCSTYRSFKPGTIHEKGIRINCMTKKALVVLAKINFNMGFSISEFEVYTMAAGIPGEDVSIYHGCYGRFSSTIEERVTNPKKCFRLCRQSTATLAALKEDFKGRIRCHCGRGYANSDTLLPNDRCGTKCDGLFCGSRNGYSVYIVHFQLPYYVGCFKVQEGDRVDTYAEDNVAKCFRRCMNHTYAGIRGKELCSCDNSLICEIAEEELCDVPCKDNIDVICSNISQISLYKLMPDHVNDEMIYLFKCADIFDEFGVCIGGCKNGYAGDYCIRARYIYCQEVNPCLDLLNTICVQFENSYRCQCLPGFQRKTVNGACSVLSTHSSTERITSTITTSRIITRTRTSKSKKLFCVGVDPCANITNTECVMVGLTYACECKDGYFNSSKDCEDIDECVDKPCDSKTSTCINSNGSYLCHCKDFYIPVTEFVCIKNDTEDFESYMSGPILLIFIIAPLFAVLVIFVLTIFIGRTIQISSRSSQISVPSQLS